jgi:AraC-like DNA-binding protein
VADRLGWSERHLRRLAQDGLGVAPKSYARLARFARVVVASDRGDRPWAQLAAEAGFADQAHQVRETVELAGCTPSVLAAERRRQDAAWVGAGRPAIPAL